MPGENRYLIIGIDEYSKNLFGKLNNAKLDGERLAKVLQDRYGFVPAIDPIYDNNATKNNILDALYDIAAYSYIEDSLIIYFAGHGFQHSQSKKGFWIPYDGEEDHKNRINNSNVLDAIEEIQAKHILLISDSCYSGTFITRTRSGGKILNSDELDALPSRWVFVSGGETPVKDGTPGDGSPFAIALCNFLEQNSSPVLKAEEVFNEVIRIVENRGGQKPAASEIQCDANQGGQMIFRLRTENKSLDYIMIKRLEFELPDSKIHYYIPRLLKYYDHQEAKEIRYYQPEVGTVYLDNLIRTQKRIVLLGAAGAGKSVELLSLAHRLQSGDDPLVPIFKRFNTYTEENIGDYLPQNWQEADSNNLVLFLDGLDEIQPKYFQTAVRKITAFAEQNPLLRIVISCRNNFYELPYNNFSGTLDSFSVYILNDISVSEVIQYVTEKFELDGQDFITKVQHASFLDLVQKPFFLNILIQYYKEHGHFNGGRGGIMEEALLKYYDNDKQHFNTTLAPLSRSAIFDMLEKVAFVMEIVGKNILTDDDIEKIFPSSEDRDRCKYLPAFNRDSATGRWMFEHNNLHEYISSRVLNRKSAAEIVDIIAVNATGELRVKPSWVNTLSFFISIGKEDTVRDLFNWIIEHDREVIVKFEPERLSLTQRIQLFKEIFNFYSGRQIWLRSNKFSDVDLARFGESSEILEFLLKVIEEKIDGRIGTLNAVHILSYYHIERFYNQHKKIQSTLLGLLENGEMPANDAYSVIGAIADLKINNDEVLAEIISKYRERRNQYIRAALYKLIITSKNVDKYIDVFIDGIDLTDLESSPNDRENVHLFDETLLLKIGLQNIKTAEGLIILLDKLVESTNKRELLSSDYREVLTSIVNKGSLLYPEHPKLFDAVLGLYIEEAPSYDTPWEPSLVSFFEKTGTRWQAFKLIWERKDLEDYAKGVTMKKLFNSNIIKEIVKYLRGLKATQIQIKEFYDFIFWNFRFEVGGMELIELYEAEIVKVFDVELERPQLKDWQQVYRIREQKSFDVWFDDMAMLREIRRVYSETGKEKLNRDEIFKYNHQSDLLVEDKMLLSVNLVFNHLTLQGRAITENEIIEFVVKSEEYQNLRISHIHSDLFNKKEMAVSEKQISFIEEWAQLIGNNRKLLWDFMNRFKFKLPDDKILELTNYTHFNYDVKISDPGTIEELEKFIPVSKIKVRVAENIRNQQIDMLVWVSNAGYAFRKNIIEVYDVIVDRIECTTGFDYKFRELLNSWFNKTKDIERLKKLIKNVSNNYTRWDAIKILEENNTEEQFLNDFFHRIIKNEAETFEEKIYAANHLMKQNDLLGFHFVADIIIDAPDLNFDFRMNLGSMPLLQDAAAIPKLIALLKIAKQPEFKTNIFNDLEDRVLGTFRNIGIQSTENYRIVKTAIEGFINENVDKIPNVNFLHFVTTQVEEQLNIKETESLTVDKAIAHYNELFR